MRDSTLKMSRLIDDILSFSRAGRLEMKPELVDMAALVRQTLTDELAVSVSDRALPIGIGVLPDAHGDRAMLRRVWMNLLDNAIKFTAGKPDARIEIGVRDGDGEAIYYVRDNGAGFDMRYADKLFGVFQRLHGAEFPGTGIGLAIVKRIVERHGGRVWAEGKVGNGATVYFTLPTMGAGCERCRWAGGASARRGQSDRCGAVHPDIEKKHLANDITWVKDGARRSISCSPGAIFGRAHDAAAKAGAARSAATQGRRAGGIAPGQG